MRLNYRLSGKIACMAAMLLSMLSSCTKEEIIKDDILSGKDALVDISFGFVDPERIETRASAEVENAVTTLHILIFNSAGIRQTLKYIADYKNATAEEKKIATRSGSNCTIYAVANMHGANSGTEGDHMFFEDVNTLTQFENKYATIFQGDVERNDGMIMVGKLVTNIDPLPTVTTPAALLLYRLSSKITINVKDGTPSGQTVNIIDYEIYNLPLYSYFASNPQDYYTNNTSLEAGAFYSGTQYNFAEADVDYGSGVQAVKQGQFYMVENRRGGRVAVGGDTGTSTDQREKAKYAPEYATYVLINGMYYDGANGKSMLVKYKVYLGANNSDDYNVERHKLYTYNITIEGVTENDVTTDSRVNATQTFFLNVWNTTMDAHYDSQAFKFSTFTGHTKVEILNIDGTSVYPATSWLKFSKLSTYPNLADDRDNALTTIETIDHTGSNPANLDTYFRYLYADENISGADRTLKLRITATDESDPAALDNPALSLVVEKEFTQKTIRLVGLFGGYFALNAEGYPNQLGVELLEEYAMTYKDGTTAPAKSGVQWGFNNVTTGVTDKEYGMAGTKVLAVRSDHGVTDTYNPIYNTFAARYCYEKNRDLNGNGALDADEIKWYLPAQNQLMGIWATYSGTALSFNAVNYWSATETNAIYSWYVGFGNGNTSNTSKTFNGRVRCVRDVTP